MAFFKRIALFILINLLVVLTISTVFHFIHIKPWISSYGLDTNALLLFCLIWGMAGAMISLALSRKMAKWMMGVKILSEDPQDASSMQLFSLVRRLAEDAELPSCPQIGIYQSKEVNAFATGPTKKRSLIAVSSGLLEKMESSELSAILAHEITHIANGDMVTMTLLQGIVNAFVMFFARLIAFLLASSGKGRSERNISYGSFYLFTILFETVFMLLGAIVLTFFSRFREYRADKGGATLAGKSNMIAALQALKRMHAIKDPKMEKKAVAAFKISSNKRGGFLRLFATHPAIDDRIARLQSME